MALHQPRDEAITLRMHTTVSPWQASVMLVRAKSAEIMPKQYQNSRTRFKRIANHVNQ